MKRFLSLLLTLMFLQTCVPTLLAYASEAEEPHVHSEKSLVETSAPEKTEPITENTELVTDNSEPVEFEVQIAVAKENQKASIVAQGTCGDNLTWTLNGDGLLTISGEGKMGDYIYSGGESIYHQYAPWRKGKDLYKLVKKIVIVSGVTYIGDYAFCELPNVASVSIPNTVQAFGVGVFCGDKKLTKINIPSGIESIPKSMFKGCTSLKNISIPTSVNQIGEAAFETCAITSITLPSGLTKISGRAFQYASLTSIVIPEGVTHIGPNAFEHNLNLNKIILPNSLIEISSYAFQSTAITTVVIPKNVAYIGNDVLGFCSKLKTAVFAGDAPDMDPYVFENTTADVYYPKGNTTWTDSVRKDYGGDLTWIAYTPLNILKQPTNVFVLQGETASVTVEAEGEGITYQWYYRNVNNEVFKKSTITKATYTCLMNVSTGGMQVYCVITDCFGNAIKSETVTLNVESEHVFGAWEEIKAPTCTDKGSERRECTNCGLNETRDVAANGHNHKTVSTEPTCTEKGYTTHTCACGDLYVDTYVDALGHTCKNTVTIAPTKMTTGNIAGTCETCGNPFTEELPVLNKTDYAFTVIEKPTDEAAGICRYTWKNSAYGEVFFELPLEKSAYIRGDINIDYSVNDDDVILLLWHTLLPDMYPIEGEADFNYDGSVNDEDVIYLLWHTLLPDMYPL